MFDGKRFLISGGNSSVGIAISELLLQNGAHLVLLYNKNRNNIDTLLTKNQNLKSKINTLQIDLMDESEIKDKIPTLVKDFPISGFIHSVSLPLSMKNITDLTWNDFQRQFDLQCRSFFTLLLEILPSMKEQKYGKVITILTTGVIGKPPNNMSDYIVGKYSLLGLTKTLAGELIRFGITINSISPPMMDTPLTENLPNALKKIISSQNPSGKLADSNDIAPVALFLSSKLSDNISGENIIVGSGQTMH
ncbi:MAG: SDR family NAD(P)-dependent oxidoreductase [Crenarchaeota archaeon]|nr:MAG: SDR family NAD(P)-dependent oxidoreductase [Thermoproteota archaeon]RDJ33323.1 MAG: SDR family NAD(P)-dependent oxidoreductase [Thermoproteota archaeon]RDJ36174.1 MAG: SDR family NAD(P)-dependent oxidoreductase [Thermoproteota archaeon]RDJ38805.1 MAG: SDR family NAD(P)-dependent oxidoreductase [Thermoproteota archaeon]